jgi:hypothetical protein
MLKPKNDDDFKANLQEWIRNFFYSYLVEQFTPLQRNMFVISWGEATQRLNPDISG